MKQPENNEIILRGAITDVIAFFDKFDFPLTSFEIWKYMRRKCEYSEVLKILEQFEILPSGEVSGSARVAASDQYSKKTSINNATGARIAKIQRSGGFYFLSNRESIVETRMRRYNYANRKFKKAIFFTHLFRLIPWVKMVAVGNVIGASNMRNAGDIDFFVVTERKRIWMTRAFCVLIAKIMRARPRINSSFKDSIAQQGGESSNKDTICLSFYADENSLDLQELTYGKNDFYFLYWLAFLVPVYDCRGYYEKLIDENLWLLNQLPNWKRMIVSDRRKIAHRKNVFYHDIIDMLIGGLEPWAKKKQLQIMPEGLARAVNHPSKAVVINDNVLKLHVNDKREEYNKKL